MAALAAAVQDTINQNVDLAYVERLYRSTTCRSCGQYGIALDVIRLPEAKRGLVLLPGR